MLIITFLLGGDKGKMEEFVNFCEDTIFEMQLASSISVEQSAEGEKGTEENEEEEEDDLSRFGLLVRTKYQTKDRLEYLNPHTPDRFTPSHARCAEKCGASLIRRKISTFLTLRRPTCQSWHIEVFFRSHGSA